MSSIGFPLTAPHLLEKGILRSLLLASSPSMILTISTEQTLTTMLMCKVSY